MLRWFRDRTWSTRVPRRLKDLSVAIGRAVGPLDEELERVEYRHALSPLLDALPGRERTILMLRFFGEMTQTQIAEQIGISQMHVSRLANCAPS
jgi:RNA polymerase sigma-B factor